MKLEKIACVDVVSVFVIFGNLSQNVAQYLFKNIFATLGLTQSFMVV